MRADHQADKLYGRLLMIVRRCRQPHVDDGAEFADCESFTDSPSSSLRSMPASGNAPDDLTGQPAFHPHRVNRLRSDPQGDHGGQRLDLREIDERQPRLGRMAAEIRVATT